MRKGALLLVLTVPAWLQAQGIRNSLHNLSTSGPGTIKSTYQTEICIYCHFPHSTGSTVFLWNHTQTTATYTFYTSPTMNAATPTTLSSSSRMCMSCHDGTVAVGDLINNPDTSLNTTFIPTTSTAYIGTDLTDDHPVSIQYEDGQFSSTNPDPDLRLRATANTVDNGAGIVLYLENERVECGTCHNPHDPTNGNFLEVSNTGSQLCLTCHLK